MLMLVYFQWGEFSKSLNVVVSGSLISLLEGGLGDATGNARRDR